MGSSASTMPANVGTSSGVPYGPGLSPQPGFSYRNVWKPLTISFIGNNNLVCNENNPEILTRNGSILFLIMIINYRRANKRNILGCFRSW